MDFPRMLYRPGTMIVVGEAELDFCIVENADDEAVALADGWKRDPIHPLDHDRDGRKGGIVKGRKARG